MFSSYDAEERVGYAFLKYGIKICNQLNKSTFRPLGLTTPPSFGFGSLVATDYALTMRSSLFLLDAWYPEKLDDTRSTIVFRDAKLFDAAVELLRRRPIQTAMSVMLLDFDEGRIVKEQWISQGLEKSARFQSSSAPVPTSAPDSVPSLVPCSSPIGHLSIIFSASFNKSSRSSEVNVLYSTSSLAGRRISQPPA